ncbi:MAG: anthranilate synthase component I [Magnetococcales bacterium]|nr:anthranilate synthase component I [Magnetococcales bacterium]
MIRPSLDRFRQLAGLGNVIPVGREILADLDTPVSAYLKVATGHDYSFLLESVQGGEKWGRYSLIGINPTAIFKAFGRRVEIERPPEEPERFQDVDPMAALRAFVERYKPVESDSELPFQGGAVGYLGYDVVRCFERIPDANPDHLQVPDILFMVPETVIVFDNLSGKMTVVGNAFLRDGEPPEAAYRLAVERVERAVAGLKNSLPVPDVDAGAVPGPAVTDADFVPEMSRRQFEQAVERAKEYIAAGDIMQVVLSQRLSIPFPHAPINLYRALRTINPSPYLFLLDLAGFTIVGSSPEILVRQDGETITVRPIAGTRPRGHDEADDKALEADLLADPKELAEHVMLVDLGRNDLGRVAVTGSVQVTERNVIERYSHVMHIVSNVEARLEPGLDTFDLIAATFPAGTTSGAPKIRAMEIIDELEVSRRGPYAGAVGYLSWRGRMDLAITIRTAIIKNGTLHIQAGAGIVADSRPDKEYEETMNKARAVFRAVDMVQKGLE